MRGQGRGPRAALAAALAVLVCAATSEGWGDGCIARSIGVDTTHANVRDVVFNGRAWSQVFVADDTLISSITVWRASSPDSNSTPIRLYVLDVIPYAYAPPIDTLIGPDPTRILLVGPQVTVPYAPDHALPARFDLNPPLALPRRGTFAFAVKEDSPFCFGISGFMFDSLNTYQGGAAWKISPGLNCTLGLGVFPYPERDFIFTIDFCELAVPTKRATWGEVKASYR